MGVADAFGGWAWLDADRPSIPDAVAKRTPTPSAMKVAGLKTLACRTRG
jgi:hypothetical protein